MGAFEIRLVAAFFLLFSTFFVSAQTWTQKLLIAERDYDAGRLVNIVDNISGGFEKSLGWAHWLASRRHAQPETDLSRRSGCGCRSLRHGR